jgi:hypothetical protein
VNELKPCPFCGGKFDYNNDVGPEDAYLEEWWECTRCGARVDSKEHSQKRVSPWRSLKDDPPEPPTETTSHAILIRNSGRELVDNRYQQLVPYNDMDNGGVLRWFEVHLDWVLEDYLDRGFTEWTEVPE